MEVYVLVSAAFLLKSMESEGLAIIFKSGPFAFQSEFHDNRSKIFFL